MKAEKQEKVEQETKRKSTILSSAKECAFAAVFVAILIVSQFAFSAIPGVEVITLLFCTYSFVFGWKRGVISAIVFSLIRQFIFGFFPAVLILYLLYYPLLCFGFGTLGKQMHANAKTLVFIVITACVCSAVFSLLDCVVTPLWYGYSLGATKGYFLATLPVACVQMACVSVQTAILFLPLERTFRVIKRTIL